MKRLRSRAVDVSSGLNEKTQACDRALSWLASLLRALQFSLALVLLFRLSVLLLGLLV
jgi:hypothetical protein